MGDLIVCMQGVCGGLGMIGGAEKRIKFIFLSCIYLALKLLLVA